MILPLVYFHKYFLKIRATTPDFWLLTQCQCRRYKSDFGLIYSYNTVLYIRCGFSSVVDGFSSVWAELCLCWADLVLL